MAVKELLKTNKQEIETQESLVPRKVVIDFSGIISFTDNQLLEISAINRDLQIELSKEGKLIIMSPMGGFGGKRETIIIAKLFNWNEGSKLGEIFSSATGFKLSDGAILSPDASFIPKNKWKAIPKELRKKFPPICPDFIVELRSDSDNLKDCKEKMADWMGNGCRLAWLIDPIEEKAYIYRLDKEIETIDTFDKKLSGENVLAKFELDLSELRVELD